MNKAELVKEMAKLVHKLLFSDDKEAETNLTLLEEKAERLFPRDYKGMQAQALNLALGHRG